MRYTYPVALNYHGPLVGLEIEVYASSFVTGDEDGEDEASGRTLRRVARHLRQTRTPPRPLTPGQHQQFEPSACPPALIALLTYSFARVSAAVTTKVEERERALRWVARRTAPGATIAADASAHRRGAGRVPSWTTEASGPPQGAQQRTIEKLGGRGTGRAGDGAGENRSRRGAKSLCLTWRAAAATSSLRRRRSAASTARTSRG